MNLIDKLFRRRRKAPPQPAPTDEVKRARRRVDELEMRLQAALIGDRNGGGHGRERRDS